MLHFEHTTTSCYVVHANVKWHSNAASNFVTNTAVYFVKHGVSCLR